MSDVEVIPFHSGDWNPDHAVYELAASIPLPGYLVAALYGKLNETAPPIAMHWTTKEMSVVGFDAEMSPATLRARVRAALRAVFGPTWSHAFEERPRP
jgi:hypothetical protein